MARTLAVTEADMMRVYAEYIQGRPHIAKSFVPRGAAELALDGSEQAAVVIEPIVQGAEAAFAVERGTDITASSSGLDRSVEPPFGDAPTLRTPTVVGDTLGNGLKVFTIVDREIPLVQFELRLRGGSMLDDADRIGVANLLAQTMT